ncbi:MAG: spoVB2, partial [Clostridiales bacterium]|nr:spoVB2 [Clostridiales bacterium]
MSKRSFVSGAIILMLSGFIVRVLGFVYRIYLSNLIGAEGMGLIQLISP